MSFDAVLKDIEAQEAAYINVLRESVRIRSLSSAAQHRPDCVTMAEWLKAKIKAISSEAKIEFVSVPYKEKLPTGEELELPPIILTTLAPIDPKKRTLLVYGHYDVQPAEMSDGWDTDPWDLIELPNGELRGRGSTDDKGPIVGWINMIESYKRVGRDIPVNFKFVFEGMEESGSVGFDDTVKLVASKSDFFKDIDFCCISDNYWISTKKPCLTYGLRGLCSVQMEVTGGKADLHSGSFGGMMYQPMDDLMALFQGLKDENENILIAGLQDEIMPITDEEKARYKDIYYDLEGVKKQQGVTKLRDEDDLTKMLMNIWRLPSLTVHGIEGAFSEPGFKTVIPRRVVGKFSIRLVPNMTTETVERLVREHLEKKFASRNSPNRLQLTIGTGRWYYCEPTSPVFKAAERATELIHNVKPDFTREGGSIPITLTLKELTGQDVVLLPMGRGDDGAHSQNEKLDRSNYLLGMKTYAAFLEELSR